MDIEEEKKEEPGFEILKNPSRVLDKQTKCISYLPENRYIPIIQVILNLYFIIDLLYF